MLVQPNGHLNKVASLLVPEGLCFLIFETVHISRKEAASPSYLPPGGGAYPGLLRALWLVTLNTDGQSIRWGEAPMSQPAVGSSYNESF